MNRLSTLAITLLLLLAISACQRKQAAPHSEATPTDYTRGTTISDWNQELTRTILKDLFPPPVASRIYAYTHLAAYEALRYAYSSAPSFAAQLKGLHIPAPSTKNLRWDVAAMQAFVTTGKKVSYTEEFLETYRQHFMDSVKGTADAALLDSSVAFGQRVADSIVAWGGKDSFKKTRGALRYTLKKSPGSWIPTPPAYMPGVEPHWGSIRTWALDTSTQYRPQPAPAFSTAKGSFYYTESEKLREVGLNIDSTQREIAIFWDDNPNVVSPMGHLEVFNQKMTPGGHWMAITGIAVKEKNLSMVEASKAYTLTALAIADAFIACWEAKYAYQTIRPITYIAENIDDKWNPLLQTPPFPEYPSGHSSISAAASEVLTALLGDNFAYTDSSEVPYALPVRSFTSFNQAADEVAISRWYGGIHYTFANDSAKVMGRKIGRLVLEKFNR